MGLARRAFERAANSGMPSRSPRTSGARPQIPDSLLDVLFRVQAGQGGGELLARVFRRWAKAARTTRKKWASSSTSAGAGRGVIRRTAEVTLGAGIKQEGGTSKSSSGAVWYWQKTEKAP